MTVLLIAFWLFLGATIGVIAMALAAASGQASDLEDVYWREYLDWAEKSDSARLS